MNEKARKEIPYLMGGIEDLWRCSYVQMCSSVMPQT